MPFGNPVVGGFQLVRNAIQSANYIAGLAGWRIARDGSAEFNTASFRGALTGPAIQATNSLTYKGVELQTILDSMPKGVVAYGQMSYVSGQAWGTGLQGPVARCSFPVTGGRLYKVTINGLQGYFTTGGPADIEWQLRIAAGATVTSTSPFMAGGDAILMGERANNSGTIDGVGGWFTGAAGTNQYTLGLFFGNTDGAGLSANLWATNPWSFVVEDVGLYPAPNGVTFGSGGTPVTFYDKTYWPPAGHVESYQQSGAVSIATNHNVYGYQGDGSAVGNPGGDTEGCFFFDYATIQADLAGATIDHCYLYASNQHCYNFAGITALIGTHNGIYGPPGSVPTSLVRRWSLGLAYGGDGWTGDVGAGIGGEFQSGATRGLCVGYSGTSDVNYYGYFANMAIRIQYHK